MRRDPKKKQVRPYPCSYFKTPRIVICLLFLILPRHSMGLPYIPTLALQTTPTDRHICHTWSVWVKAFTLNCWDFLVPTPGTTARERLRLSKSDRPLAHQDGCTVLLVPEVLSCEGYCQARLAGLLTGLWFSLEGRASCKKRTCHSVAGKKTFW